MFASMKKAMIYKGARIINWCPVCKTSISDAEVEYEDQAGHFWHINYPVVGSDEIGRNRYNPSGDYAGRYGGGRTSGR